MDIKCGLHVCRARYLFFLLNLPVCVHACVRVRLFSFEMTRKRVKTMNNEQQQQKKTTNYGIMVPIM